MIAARIVESYGKLSPCEARGRILAIKWGMNPNSSSLGVDVTFLLAGATALAIVTPVLGALLRWRMNRSRADEPKQGAGEPALAPATPSVRSPIGCALFAQHPPRRGAVRAVRRDRPARRCRARSCSSIARWRGASSRVDRRAGGVARAPRPSSATHVLSRAARGAPPAHEPLRRRLHRAATPARRRKARRTSGASPSGSARSIALADAGVFHVALGGGESAALPWLGELADHARARGIIPNLTTSGLDGLDALARDRRSVRPDQRLARRARRDLRRGARLRRLRARRRGDPRAARGQARGRHQRRRHAPQLRRARRASSRTPPSAGSPRSSCCGSSRRAAAPRAYAELRCTDAQHRAFLPTILAAAKRHRVRVKVDCSYTPMLAHHAPDRALLAELAVYGCTGGDFLVGAKPDGRLTACSFASPPPPLDGAAPARRPSSRRYWTRPDAFGAFRTLARCAPSRARAAATTRCAAAAARS